MSDRVLTASDMRKLPVCTYHRFERCTGHVKNCFACQLQVIAQSLFEENLALAQHHLEVLCRILEEKGLLKDE